MRKRKQEKVRNDKKRRKIRGVRIYYFRMRIYYFQNANLLVPECVSIWKRIFMETPLVVTGYPNRVP